MCVAKDQKCVAESMSGVMPGAELLCVMTLISTHAAYAFVALLPPRNHARGAKHACTCPVQIATSNLHNP